MRERGDFEDQTDATIGQDGGAGKERVIMKCVTKAFYDNFLFADEFVNQNATLRAVGFDDDENGCSGIGLAGIDG